MIQAPLPTDFSTSTDADKHTEIGPHAMKSSPSYRSERENDAKDIGNNSQIAVGLSSLPMDVLFDIVQRVYEMAPLEASEVHTRRLQSLGDSTKTLYHQTGIFNSIQSLAAVNKDLHQVCVPWLWKKVLCPRFLPRKRNMWTEFICPKYGALIQSLTICLSRESLGVPDERPGGGKMFENIRGTNSSPNNDFEEISKEIVLESLERCRSLQTLVMICPSMFHSPRRYDEDQYSDGLYKLLDFLTPSISNLTDLRHLELDNSWGPLLCEKHVKDLLSKLPLLESFTGTRIKICETIGEEYSLGLTMSQLKRLTLIRLCQVDSVDFNWCIHSWNQSLTRLELVSCSGISLAVAHNFVHLFSSTLNTLTLSFGDFVQYDIEYEGTAGQNWPLQHCYQLPRLTTLNLEYVYPGFLSAFRRCDEVRHLDLKFADRFDWLTLDGLVCATTWSKLLTLDTTKTRVKSPSLQILDRLNTFCNQGGIKFS